MESSMLNFLFRIARRNSSLSYVLELVLVITIPLLTNQFRPSYICLRPFWFLLLCTKLSMVLTILHFGDLLWNTLFGSKTAFPTDLTFSSKLWLYLSHVPKTTVLPQPTLISTINVHFLWKMDIISDTAFSFCFEWDVFLAVFLDNIQKELFSYQKAKYIFLLLSWALPCEVFHG